MISEAHILVVDDDPVIRDLLKEYLSNESYHVTTAGNGMEMRRVMAETPVDLVLLDLMMPGEDGLTLTRYFREHSDVAIIILTSKSDAVDRVVGLEMGADDYISKPFDLREILARIRSVLRRHNAASTEVVPEIDAELKPQPRLPGSNTTINTLCFSGWELNLDLCQLLSPQNEEIPLTKGEYQLLLAFLEHPKRVLTRNELLDITHNDEIGPYDRGIDIQVSRLRRKLGDDPTNPELIKTVRGIGYALATVVTKKCSKD